MKNLIAALTLTSLTFSAFAADVLTDSDTLSLKGKVDKKVSIVVTPTASALLLDLSASPGSLKVADVTERANVSAGYKVTITSANGGKLVHESDSSEFVSYDLEYNSNPIVLSNPSAGQNEVSYTARQLQPVDRDVTISYTGRTAESMLAGDYTDTVTFAIAAN